MELEMKIRDISHAIKLKLDILTHGRPGDAFNAVVRDMNCLTVKKRALEDQLARIRDGKGNGVVMDPVHIPIEYNR